MNLKKLFLKYCEDEQLEKNQNQFDIIESLHKYYIKNFKQSFLSKVFKKKDRLGFYLVGDVGVGKTMILNFFFSTFKRKKIKTTF